MSRGKGRRRTRSAKIRWIVHALHVLRRETHGRGPVWHAVTNELDSIRRTYGPGARRAMKTAGLIVVGIGAFMAAVAKGVAGAET